MGRSGCATVLVNEAAEYIEAFDRAVPRASAVVRSRLPPDSDRQQATVHHLQAGRTQRTRVLGGLINEYRYIA
jgi:hypothetical protein